MAQMHSPNSTKNLHMLGIIHRDERNGECVRRYLDRIAPDAVTIEFSPYGLQFRKNNNRRYAERLDSVRKCMHNEGVAVNEVALSELNAYINTPSEYESARAYCTETGTSLHLIDMNSHSRRNLNTSEELFSEENIRKVAAADDRGLHKRERILAELFFNAGINTAVYSHDMCVRDRHMYRIIQSLLQKKSCRHIVHITGWRHLRDPQQIFAQLDPVKVFPYD
ncbi:MAG TPA: hypothetical protein VHO84_00690 [Syntrophorhabdaceae bacterium]|nr:hypothetical protein [Syntrophorhabdaceae bacterium]